MFMKELESQLLADLGESCLAVLGQSGDIDSDSSCDLDSLVAVVGFSGSHIRGAVGIRMPLAVAQATHPMGKTVDDLGELGDWTSEVSNQLLGGVKARLCPRGYDVWCSTPVVLKGVRLEFVGQAISRVLHFDSGNAVAWVQVAWAVEVENNAGDDVMMPGEMMLF